MRTMFNQLDELVEAEIITGYDSDEAGEQWTISVLHRDYNLTRDEALGFIAGALAVTLHLVDQLESLQGLTFRDLAR